MIQFKLTNQETYFILCGKGGGESESAVARGEEEGPGELRAEPCPGDSGFGDIALSAAERSTACDKAAASGSIATRKPARSDGC